MRKLLALLFALFALTSVQAQEVSESENKCGDNLTWSYDEATRVLTIAGDGAMYDYPSSFDTPWSDVRTKIKVVKFTGSPTRIGKNTFYSCYDLANIEIPSSVKSIGDGAFKGCNLTSITIPASVDSIGVDAFYSCRYIESVNIAEGVKSIGDGAFKYCSGFTSITIPASVTSFGAGVFENCTLLESVSFAEGATIIGEDAFSGCSALTNVEIPSSVKSIGGSAFNYCKALTNIEIPSSVKSIGNYAFYYCTALTNVEISEGVESIGNNAFFNCTGLASITIPASVDSIGEYAFYACSGFTSIEISEGVTSIGHAAFYGCTGLTSITIPASVTNVGRQVFGNCSGLTDIYPSAIIGNDMFNSCTGLKNIKIPASVDSIGNSAFGYCTGLESVEISEGVTSIGSGVFVGCSALASIVVDEENTVYDSRDNCNAIIETATNALVAGCNATTIPASVESIGDNAFSYCKGLTSIEIPEGSTSIGDYAFSNCTGLISITIPASVESIGDYALYGCSGLTSIEIPASVKSIGDYAFSRCTGLTSIEFPESLESIGGSAFLGCTGLTSIKIPASVESIGQEAFIECTAIESIVVDEENKVYDSRDNCNAIIETATNNLIKGCNATIIPKSIKSIGESALRDCSGLTSVEIPEGVTSIGDAAFYGCSGLTSIKIPGSVTTIGVSAFIDCSGLTSVEISEGVKNLSTNMFGYCWNLASIELPEGLTTIERYAFRDCSSLTSIKIPASVDSIGQSAFYGCSGLKSIASFIPADKLFYLNRSIFNHTNYYNNCTLFVPSGSRETYATAGYWSKFKNIIEFEGQCGDNIFWSFDEADGALTIGGVGAMNDYSSSSRAPWYDSREKIKTVKILSDVTSIGANALSGCTAVTSIVSFIAADELSVPDSNIFEDISKENCSVYVPKGSKSKYASTEQWKDFSNIIEFDGQCGDNLYWALDETTGTLSIYGEGAMYDYDSYDSYAPWYDSRKNIKAINFIGAPTSIGSRAFNLCENFSSIEIPETVTSIGDRAFSYCYSLSSVNIPASVESIGQDVFYTCHGIASIVVDEENTAYDSRNNCNAIVETATNTLITGCWSSSIPDGIVNIADYAFYNCYGLSKINIPASVKNIGDFAFFICIGVTTIVVDEENTVYDSRDNCNALIETATNTLKLGCKFTVIPEGVTSIGDYAFYGCSTLTDIEIPEGVTRLGHYAFYNCIALTDVKIPDGVTSIGDYTFSSCSSLRSIVSHIAPEDLFIVDDNTFRGIDGACTLYVDYGAKETYAAIDGWKNITNIVEAYDLTVSAAGYATLYLGTSVEIPTGVEAYTAARIEGDRLKMQAVEGVIPANSAVVIKAEEGNYLFAYSDDTPDAIESNLLRGTLTDTYIKPSGAQTAYVLSTVDGVVGMYRAKLKADGTFKNNANRAYMLLGEINVGEGDLDTSNPGGQLSNGYRFDFSGTTAIEGIETESAAPAVYYDLSGRRVENPTRGIYIVNGKKVYIK